jgi:hypothetical protein
VGYTDDEMHRISTSSFIPGSGISPLVRGKYRPRAMPNGITYLFAAGAVLLPLLGLIAIVLAIRSIRQERERAWLALVVAIVATALGVLAWVAFMPSSSPVSPQFVG